MPSMELGNCHRLLGGKDCWDVIQRYLTNWAKYTKPRLPTERVRLQQLLIWEILQLAGS